MKKTITNIKTFYGKCKRVWYTLKKPTKEEWHQVAKISAVGIGAIGLLGFLISLIIESFI